MSDSITGTVWDGTRALGTATLAWSGDRIDSVTSSSGESDLSIIPGLVDTHVHLGAYSGEGSADFTSWGLITRARSACSTSRTTPARPPARESRRSATSGPTSCR
ncbi:hypothetical protein Q0F99_09925 [Rathayibacter oskolensis]|uniref:hypothetical protein n=1 Tax=Rathayibacter oskolensis TaxID=1891671 RepID=UPI00265DA369|nr:hypothetical protein [Rathayibacter oskolensis]WKK73122.1 hypothetical protein Q0F99_09925 [Rathayibacter oskolensis]